VVDQQQLSLAKDECSGRYHAWYDHSRTGYPQRDGAFDIPWVLEQRPAIILKVYAPAEIIGKAITDRFPRFFSD
jgi:hypothetical protein